ncbi:MAG: hypothetical protein WA231_04385, partial [Methylocella sp.]
ASPRSLGSEICLRKSGIGLLPRDLRQGNGGRANAGAKDVMTSRENRMAAKTNRARASDALKPSKLFEGARPRPARPQGEAEHA